MRHIDLRHQRWQRLALGLLATIWFACSQQPAGEEPASIASTAAALCSAATLTTNPTSYAALGAQVAMTVSATCAGANAQYRFAAAHSDAPSQVFIIRDWGTANTAMWNTSGLTSGSYTLYAYAREATTTGNGWDTMAYGGITLGAVCDSASVAVSPVSSYPATAGTAPKPVGTQITITPTATCHGTGPTGATTTPEFQYFYLPPASAATYVQICPAGQTTCANTWSTGNPVLDTTGFPSGTYGFYVRARGKGNASALESSAYAPNGYLLGNVCTSVALTTAPAGTAPTSKVRLTATATCASGVSPEYHFVFRNPATDSSWHDITPTFGGPTVVWDTNWKAGTPLGSSYEIQVLARGINNADMAEAFAVNSLVLNSPAQVGAGTTCTTAAQCDDGIVSTVDTCSSNHCSVEPNAHGTQTLGTYALPPTDPMATPVAPTTPVAITVGLPLRTPAGQATLEARVDAMSDPKNPQYRKWMNATDLAAYLPPSADTTGIVAWAAANQLTAKTNPGTTIVSVSGTADKVQKALYVRLVTGKRPDGSTFFGPDRVPSLDLATPLNAVSGVDNYVLPKPAFHGNGPAPSAYPNFAAGPTLLSADLRGAYLGGVGSSCNSLTGAGQGIGILSAAAFNPADIAQFQTTSHLASVPPVQVVTDLPACPTTTFGCVAGQPYSYIMDDNLEISMDVEAAMAMAPGAQIFVFEGSTFESSFAQMIARPQIKQFTSSWGFGGGNVPTLMAIMAAQGQTVFAASGDEGDIDSTGQPSNCTPDSNGLPPYVVMVGGTDLAVSPQGLYDNEGIYDRSSGGILPAMVIPPWQQNINPDNKELSTRFRNIPDVSMPGTGVYMRATSCNGDFVGNKKLNATCNVGSVTCDANQIVTGCGATGAKSFDMAGTGTSASSPLWAGFMALINQSLALSGAPPVGYANPTFYGIASNSDLYKASFNDVKNRPGEVQAADCTTHSHKAVAGYDLVTGLGSPQCGLIAQMAHPKPAPFLEVRGTGTLLASQPLTLCGTGRGFMPGELVTFTLSNIPGFTGPRPPSAVGVNVTADNNGNIGYTIPSFSVPSASFCSPSQDFQATLTAHDVAGVDISVSATFDGEYFCSNATTPGSFNGGCP